MFLSHSNLKIYNISIKMYDKVQLQILIKSAYS